MLSEAMKTDRQLDRRRLIPRDLVRGDGRRSCLGSRGATSLQLRCGGHSRENGLISFSASVWLTLAANLERGFFLFQFRKALTTPVCVF